MAFFDGLVSTQLPKLRNFRRSVEQFITDVSLTEDIYQVEANERHEKFSHSDRELTGQIIGLQNTLTDVTSDLEKHRSILKDERNKVRIAQQTEQELVNSCAHLSREKTRSGEELNEFRNGHLNEQSLAIAYSRHFAVDIILPAKVIHLIFAALDLRSLIMLERVNHAYRDAVHCWHGWQDPWYEHLYKPEVLCDEWFRSTPGLDGSSFAPSAAGDSTSLLSDKIDTLSVGSGSVISRSSQAVSSINGGSVSIPTHPKFRRFVLTIESGKKRGSYKVEVIGFIDKEMSRGVKKETLLDISRRKVVLQPIEGDTKLMKEFSICDVLLQNHQTLAELNAEMERLKTKLESDDSVKKGYLLTTQNLTQEIDQVDSEVKNLELQQQSDITTVQFLQSEITQLQSALDELSKLPSQIEAEDQRDQMEFERLMTELENEESSSLKEELERLVNERDLLAREIEIQQSNFRQVNAERDELKQRWQFLKDEISKHNS